MSKLFFIFCLLVGQAGFSQNTTSNSDSLLRKNLINLREDWNCNNQQLLFASFPSDALQFVCQFGNRENIDSSDFWFSSLYNLSFNIVDTFFQLDSIPKDSIIYKCIFLTQGLEWQADGVNYFQQGLRNFVNTNTELVVKLLSSVSSKEIDEFWEFYFMGYFPYKLTKAERNIKKIDEKVWKIVKYRLRKTNKRIHKIYKDG
jgi:hypothetical protein